MVLVKLPDRHTLFPVTLSPRDRIHLHCRLTPEHRQGRQQTSRVMLIRQDPNRSLTIRR